MDLKSRTAQLFANTFLGQCDFPPVTPYQVPLKPPSACRKRRAVPGKKAPIKIVHYSDIHVDPFYTPGSNTKCGKPICCRNYPDTGVAANTTSAAGPNGDHNCDAPLSLEASMYEAIKKLVPDASLYLFTGDIIDHAVWNTTKDQNILDINDAYSRMTKFGKPVYGTIGNHEASPLNDFPSIKSNNNASQWVYDTLSTDWTQWIGTGPAASVKQFGAYSVKHPKTNLRVISLNTNMYYAVNFDLYSDPMEVDPNGQITWLAAELQAAESAGERVYIIGHIPTGSSDVLHDQSNYLDQVLNRYSTTISGMFFGHTHTDSFEITYSDYTNRSAENAKAVQYIVPSMTPTSGYPAFRVYSVDPDTFLVLDSTTYIANMSNPSFQSPTGPIWTKYYSARETYGPLVSPPLPAHAELSPAFWHTVTEGLKANDTAFGEYYARKSRGWDVEVCTGACKEVEICMLQAARAESNCVVPTPPPSPFAKREVGGHGGHHDDDCGFSILKELFSSRTYSH